MDADQRFRFRRLSLSPPVLLDRECRPARGGSRSLTGSPWKPRACEALGWCWNAGRPNAADESIACLGGGAGTKFEEARRQKRRPATGGRSRRQRIYDGEGRSNWLRLRGCGRPVDSGNSWTLPPRMQSRAMRWFSTEARRIICLNTPPSMTAGWPQDWRWEPRSSSRV